MVDHHSKVQQIVWGCRLEPQLDIVISFVLVMLYILFFADIYYFVIMHERKRKEEREDDNLMTCLYHIVRSLVFHLVVHVLRLHKPCESMHARQENNQSQQNKKYNI